MSKAILISIRPQWVEKILNGIKKDEIRKGTTIGKAINKLIKEQGVAPTFIYCTKGKWGLYDNRSHITSASDIFFIDRLGYDKPPLINGKVVARFNATVDLLELKMIEGGLFFAKQDKEVIELDLNENAQIDNWQLLHYTGEKLGTQISDIHINDLEIFDKPKELSEFIRDTGRIMLVGNDLIPYCEPLTRAPQSFCFIEIE